MSQYKSDTDTMNSAKASQREQSRSDMEAHREGLPVDIEGFEAGCGFLKQKQLLAKVQQYMPQGGERQRSNYRLKWEKHIDEDDDLVKRR